MKNFILAFIDGLTQIYIILIVIRAFMTWLRQDVVLRFRGFFVFVASLVDPLLLWIRRLFPTAAGGIDIAPIIAILVVMLLKTGFIMLVNLLFPGA
ncbi:MAG: YggT family protein [Candidatus Goldiibacteriota bacterium]